jgi:thiol-disulfide isomerase/thioredoxin
VAAVPSTMLPLGTPLPEFALPDTRPEHQGETVMPQTFHNEPALLVMFICNHCPFVKHIRHELARLGRDYLGRGVGIIAINSNDAERYPDDSPATMTEEAAAAGYDFPYCFDETQEVARRFRASCTPDFYLFDRDRRLVYRGQLDDSRPPGRAGAPEVPVTGGDVRAALDAVLAGQQVNAEQKPSIGCNIKWKLGNEPEWFRS